MYRLDLLAFLLPLLAAQAVTVEALGWGNLCQ